MSLPWHTLNPPSFGLMKVDDLESGNLRADEDDKDLVPENFVNSSSGDQTTVSRTPFQVLDEKYRSLEKDCDLALKIAEASQADLAKAEKKLEELRSNIARQRSSPMSLTFNSTKRGIATSLAKSFDESEDDFKLGFKRHDEVIYNYALTVHETPEEVLLSILGESRDTFPGGLQQVVVQRTPEDSTFVVHWRLQQSDKVSYEFLMILEEVREVHGDQKIIKIYIDSVDKPDVDVKLDKKKTSTHKAIWLEVRKGEIVLAPEKVRRSLDDG